MTLAGKFKTARSWTARIGIVLGVWLIFVLIMNQLVMPIYIRNWSEIDVPDLRGLSQEEAEKVAKKEHVKVVVQDEQFLADVIAGTILEQFPAPGGEVKPGRRVHVIVAAGAPMTTVPFVVGLSREEAALGMNADGLVIDTLHYAFSDSVFENQVMAQLPDSGTVLQRESLVELTISLGEEPRQIIVPDVIDLPYEQARYLILKAGLSIGTVEYDRYIGRRKGAVMNQDPPSNRIMERDDPVRLEVNYPEGWTKPDTTATALDSLATELDVSASIE
jgi:eukaryotic-like serine/threonine-protein kinase